MHKWKDCYQQKFIVNKQMGAQKKNLIKKIGDGSRRMCLKALQMILMWQEDLSEKLLSPASSFFFSTSLSQVITKIWTLSCFNDLYLKLSLWRRQQYEKEKVLKGAAVSKSPGVSLEGQHPGGCGRQHQQGLISPQSAPLEGRSPDTQWTRSTGPYCNQVGPHGAFPS